MVDVESNAPSIERHYRHRVAVVSPAFANPALEAEEDYAGSVAAQKASWQAEMAKGSIIFHSNHVRR